MMSRMRTVIAGVAMSVGFAGTVSAQALRDGCPSGPIRDRFAEFGRTGQMPPDLGQWLDAPAAQHVEPWSPFDNVDYVDT